ncbi:LysE family transporter, partial [Aquimarina celericrescens]|nr:LysE family transporter [Aquimarina celericrescens]
RLSGFFLKGFSVNFFNPFVFMVWIGVYNYGQYTYPEDGVLLIFISAVLAGILTTDLLKVFLSKMVKRFISTQRLSLLFKITGGVLILFSIRLLYFVF